MKDTRALLFGGVIGAASSVVSLYLKIPTISLLVMALSLLVLFSLGCVVYFSTAGWPKRNYRSFDIYDMFRVITGASLAVVAVTIIASATTKLAISLSLSYPIAGTISVAFFLSYITMGCALFALSKR